MLVLLLSSLLLPWVLLTALGARRRGSGVALGVLAGVVFPMTWAVWYVRDKHPYRAPHVV